MKRFKSKINNIKQIVQLAHDLDKKIILYSMLCALSSSITPIVTIVVSSLVIEGISVGKKPEFIITIALIGVFIYFSITLLSGWFSKELMVRRYCAMMKHYSLTGEATMSFDYPLLEAPSTQEMRSRMQIDTNWGSGIYGVYTAIQTIFQGFFAIVLSFAVLFPLLKNSTLLTSNGTLFYLLFVVLVTVTVLCIHVFCLSKLINAKFKVMSKLGMKTNLHIDYKSGKDVRIYGAQELVLKWISTFTKARKKCVNAASTYGGLSGGLSGISDALIQGGAYLFIGLHAVSGLLGVGEVVRYAGAVYQFSNALSMLISSLGELTIAVNRQGSTWEYLNTPHILHQGTLPVEKRNDSEYALEFRNVSFQYPGSEGYVLKNLNLKLNVGQRLAVVGMNGSGKTTMIKLLCRLYDPTEGEITLNGINIKKYNYEEYMSLFSVVFQDFKLFSFSLGQNVAASAAVDNAKARDCLEKAGFIERNLPNGLNTYLFKDFEENGVEISGGEAQKIALARALYKDAPFVILDEPTAALDPIAEFEIYSKFDIIAGSKTAIYISHRLSSCRFCDDIAVFHEGRLIQRGNHDTLAQDESGKYHELWHAQAQYYAEEKAC